MYRKGIARLINESIRGVDKILNENRDDGLNHAEELSFRRLALSNARTAHLKGDDALRDEFLRQALTGFTPANEDGGKGNES